MVFYSNNFSLTTWKPPWSFSKPTSSTTLQTHLNLSNSSNFPPKPTQIQYTVTRVSVESYPHLLKLNFRNSSPNGNCVKSIAVHSYSIFARFSHLPYASPYLLPRGKNPKSKKCLINGSCSRELLTPGRQHGQERWLVPVMSHTYTCRRMW